MLITLTQVLIEKHERKRIEYDVEANWIPITGTIISTGNHQIEVVRVKGEVGDDRILQPVIRCRAEKTMRYLDRALSDGWKEVDSASR